MDWEGVLQRWTSEYRLLESNRVETYIEPRGLDRLLSRLRASEFDHVVTGSAYVLVSRRIQNPLPAGSIAA